MKIIKYLFTLSTCVLAITSCESTIRNNNLRSNNIISRDMNDNTCTITFNPNGGIMTGSRVLNVKKGIKFGEIANKPIVTFDSVSCSGWCKNDTSSYILDDDLISENITLKADWKKYNVTFNAGEGKFLDGSTSKTLSNKVLVHGDETPNIVAPTDKTFEGWILDSTSQIISFPFKPSGSDINVGFTAKFTNKESVYVSIIAGNGKFEDNKKSLSAKVKKGTSLKEAIASNTLKYPTIDGDLIFGKYQLNGIDIDETYQFNSSVLLTSRYDNAVAVTFDANEGIYSDSSKSKTSCKIKYDKTLKISEFRSKVEYNDPQITIGGTTYDLSGWALDDDANSPINLDMTLEGLGKSSSFTLKAYYKNPHKINFSGSGCSFPTEDILYSRNGNLEFKVAPSLGYALTTDKIGISYNSSKYTNTNVSKSIDSDGAAKIVITNAPNEDISVQMFADAINYDIKCISPSKGLNWMDTTIDGFSVSKAHIGQTVTIKYSLTDGYELSQSPYVINEATSEYVTVINNKFTMPAGNVKVYIKTQTISYSLVSNLSTGIESIVYSRNGITVKSATVEDTIKVTGTAEEGYTFKDMTLSGGISHTTTERSYEFKMCAANVYTTASATPKEYTINYYDYSPGETRIQFSGTHESGYPTKHTYDQVTYLKSASKKGYKFDGWYTTRLCESSPVSEIPGRGFISEEYLNIYLYAHWTPKTYSIIYRDQGDLDFSGTHESRYPTTHTYNKDTYLEDYPVKTGYTFKGWYLDKDCQTDRIFQIDKETVDNDITIYAKWQINNYNITINSEDVTKGTVEGSGEYNYNTTCTAKASPKIGYAFDGWYEDKTKVSSDISYSFTVTKTITLTAKFKVDCQPFDTCSWDYVRAACDALEEADFSSDAISLFCSKFKYNGAKITSLDSLIGIIRQVTINNQIHEVQVIGVQHDIDENNKKLALTFDFRSLICDSNGSYLAYLWNDTNDSSTANFDYTNSSIRYTLNGTGNNNNNGETILAACRQENTWSKDYSNKKIIDMLPKDLTDNIKTVKKTVGTTSKYTETSFTDKLFIVSGIENGLNLSSGGLDKGYGTVYSLYKNGADSKRRKYSVQSYPAISNPTTISDSSLQKYKGSVANYADVTGNSGTPCGRYWTRSPFSYTTNGVWYCHYGSTGDYNRVYDKAFGIAPAFCI